MILLKQLREEHNLTQSQMAEKIGYSQQSISFIENGKRSPSTKQLKKISKIFGVSLNNLLEVTNESDRHTKQKRKSAKKRSN
jgi:transcriptional regulator with XRE-family HTH domain